MTTKKNQSQHLNLTALPGESHAKVIAEAMLRPTIRAASTVNAYRTAGISDLDLGESVKALAAQCEKVKAGDLSRAEDMLITQVHSLDAIFNLLAVRAAHNVGEHMGAVETYLRLALKAQAQSRATLETLAAIKNPPVVFARQTNIAHGPQQINNGITSEPTHVGNLQSRPIELLEENHDHRLDSGTARAASRSDSALETVGAIHRRT